MEDNKDLSNIEEFTRKIMTELPEEIPSSSFTKHIMRRIVLEEKTDVYQSHIKISYSIWFVIFGFIVATAYLLLNTSASSFEIPYVDRLSLKQIEMFSFPESWVISKSVVYTSCIFALLFGVQSYYMKAYFSHRVQ